MSTDDLDDALLAAVVKKSADAERAAKDALSRAAEATTSAKKAAADLGRIASELAEVGRVAKRTALAVDGLEDPTKIRSDLESELRELRATVQADHSLIEAEAQAIAELRRGVDAATTGATAALLREVPRPELPVSVAEILLDGDTLKARRTDGETVSVGRVRRPIPGGLSEARVVSLIGEHGGGASAWGGITGLIADQADLVTELAGKEAAGTAAGLLATHEAAGNPHPVYLTAAEGNAAYEAIGAVAAHAALPDPHTVYQRESEKGAANGYPSLDGSGLVPVSQLPGIPSAWGAITGTLSAQTDLQAALDAKTTLAAVYPVGCIYTSTVSTNPATVFGFGTWAAFGAGRVLVGLDSGQTEFDTVEETGGAKTHTLTSAEMPSHTHTQNSHNHTQDAHTHTQNAHTHTLATGTGSTGNFSQVIGTVDTSSGGTGGTPTQTALGTISGSSTATNQNATATNQAATATNQNTGGDGAHNNLQPYIVVHFFKRTA